MAGPIRKEPETGSLTFPLAPLGNRLTYARRAAYAFRRQVMKAVEVNGAKGTPEYVAVHVAAATECFRRYYSVAKALADRGLPAKDVTVCTRHRQPDVFQPGCEPGNACRRQGVDHHRGLHPDVWQEADVFDPDRFTPERAAQRPKGAYFPFLGGPHQCIGNEFAMLEMCLIVAMVLQEFDLELLPDQAIRPLPKITLRPNGPVRMALHLVDREAHHWPVMSS